MRLAVAGATREPPAAAPAGSRPAAVLVPLFSEDGEARVILTRRAATLTSHRSEVAFPGGTVGAGEGEEDAALREAHEEIGLAPAAVSVIGRLDRLVTPTTGFALTPFVGLLGGRPELRPGPGEVEEILDVPLSLLLDPTVFREERWDRPLPDRAVYFFELERNTVWGVTARILHDFLCLVVGDVSGRTGPPGPGPAPGRGGTTPPGPA